MKKSLLLIALLLELLSLSAQTRKYTASFQVFPAYYNPAMTGFAGNNINAYYRSSRWVGFEGAPKTYFVSGDFSVKRHAFGAAFLHDSFGPYRESEVVINYGFHINLTKTLKLRAGAAATINMQRVDMSALEMNAQNDPAFQSFVQDFNKNMTVDVNIGLALTGNNFYVGYALQNAAQGSWVSKDDFFDRSGYVHHVAQAGIRKGFSKRFGLIVNGLYRYDATFLYSAEAQLKAVLHNTVWVGLGYRSDQTSIGLIGFKAKQLQVGFAYELPGQSSTQANAGTTELLLSYKFKNAKIKIIKTRKKPDPKALSIW